MNITLIVPYFGKWPPWFPAFLLSCKHNPEINWLFITDCKIPDVNYGNVQFIADSIQGLSKLASEKLGYHVPLSSPYKICDLRPAFGNIFDEHLTECRFWGHCDVDIVWGDIRKYITNDILNSYSVISARKHNIAGHFSLYKNNSQINSLYTVFPKFKEMIQSPNNYLFDENGMTQILNLLLRNNLIKVYWPKYLLNFFNPKNNAPSNLTGYTEGWYWADGKLFDQTEGNNEIMYLHFMTWKDSLKRISFDYGDEPDKFYITSTSIYSA